MLRDMTSLSTLTTLRLGGPARRIITCTSEESLVHAIRDGDNCGEPLLLLGGGSNVVVADSGFDGTVVLVRTSGIVQHVAGDQIVLDVSAGESWDGLVARCVETELAGIECLSGIPGTVGATPIQNVGAYGQEVSATIESVVVYDRWSHEVQILPAERCGFAYRWSCFKESSSRWVVLRVRYRLRREAVSAPIAYGELAGTLGLQMGDRATLAEVRAAVLSLRRHKGMVTTPDDRDTWSAGSFFVNPVLDPAQFDHVRARVLEHLGPEARFPSFPQADGRAKTSAAWLIDHAGFARGQGDPHGIAISSKHILALTNRGQGTTAELIALARTIVRRVAEVFHVELQPEPQFVGVEWRATASLS
jgi:UDP-N-acetylmuramate dehydrogenase